jgi:hypothetical protein
MTSPLLYLPPLPQVEHSHLLSGTPLQNNTTELWALLSFLDPNLFPSLQDFEDEFGTLTDASQARAWPHTAGGGEGGREGRGAPHAAAKVNRYPHGLHTPPAPMTSYPHPLEPS